MPPQARFDDCCEVTDAKSPRSISATFAPRVASAAAETAPLMPPPSTSTSKRRAASLSRLVSRSEGAGGVIRPRYTGPPRRLLSNPSCVRARGSQRPPDPFPERAEAMVVESGAGLEEGRPGRLIVADHVQVIAEHHPFRAPVQRLRPGGHDPVVRSGSEGGAVPPDPAPFRGSRPFRGPAGGEPVGEVIEQPLEGREGERPGREAGLWPNRNEADGRHDVAALERAVQLAHVLGRQVPHQLVVADLTPENMGELN